MSYILEALRKSDQQRRVGKVPTLTFAPQAPLATESHAKASYGTLGVIVIITVGLVMAWLRPLSTAPVPVLPVAEKPAETSAHRPVPVLSPGTPELIAPTSSRVVAPPISPPVLTPKAPAAAGAGKHQPQAKAIAADRTLVPAMESGLPGNAPDTDITLPKPVVATAELPQSIRKTLPLMTVAVHAYSDRAADRLVSINGRLLHEGDALAPGLRLEEITPDGMIFSYRGYRFRRGAQ